jgi:hypothetical protein
MSAERKIYNVMMRTVDSGSVPDGFYGPETCRWASPGEMRRFCLIARPIVHLDANGEVDCYFTETEAVVVAHLFQKRSPLEALLHETQLTGDQRRRRGRLLCAEGCSRF